jgi:hypothetical protein
VRSDRPACDTLLLDGDSRPDAPGLPGVRKPWVFFGVFSTGDSDLGGTREGGCCSPRELVGVGGAWDPDCRFAALESGRKIPELGAAV